MRATIAAIPYAGGALDHLLFDRADEIRLENLETSLSALRERLNDLGESSLDASWFKSTEALAMFRMMADIVQFEPDDKKIEAIGKVIATAGSNKIASDKRKLSVLGHIADLSFVQMKLLRILGTMTPQRKELSGGSLTQSATGLWLTDILKAVETNPDGQFWDGQMQLDLELEILCSTNTVSRVPMMVSAPETVYALTPLGKIAACYLENSRV